MCREGLWIAARRTLLPAHSLAAGEKATSGGLFVRRREPKVGRHRLRGCLSGRRIPGAEQNVAALRTELPPNLDAQVLLIRKKIQALYPGRHATGHRQDHAGDV